MIRVILTDIEGTTSDIHFVHNVLFPYAAKKLPYFVRAHTSDSAVAVCLDQVAELGHVSRDDIEALIATLLNWIAEDKKITPLKTLQGMIWKTGYETGAFKAHVYPDATRLLQQWHQHGLALYVYSSGSIAAQKLFFGYSEAGDLTPIFSGYFDTTTGPKREQQSYSAIQQAIGIPASEILFLSDIVEELDAASAAGMQTAWLQRDGSQALIEKTPHQCVRDFSELSLNKTR
ncbi:acireductone synthase [Spongiibacter sp. KMU-158]|uniref:Enolase-phosphatase E1 n=1 Tax=Spongiibacter pelagi TaxID=2760804 RepID=A0A927GW65_9GAMM|nr:acireductone synthase [Spongiibacter pelagi]MBD2858109.1 acireductone synthase [Spongiibacter pelagi]